MAWRRLGLPTRIAALAGAASMAGVAASVVAAPRVALDRPGHVYQAGEQPLATFAGAPGGAQYTLVDFYGAEVAKGPVPADKTPVPLSAPGPGYYTVRISGGAAATTLAVLPAGSDARRSRTFGVATHFAQGWDTDIIPLIGAAGIGTVRDEQYWANVEKKPGEYRFPAHFTRYMDALAGARIDPLLVLSFANPLYDGGDTPTSDAARDAFAAYAVAVVRRYGGQVRALEVWNEYNGSFCKGRCRQDRPAHYAALLKTTAAALRAHDPALTVVGGAAVKVPLPWFEALARHGAARAWDAVAVHPYRPHPEGVEVEIAELQARLRQAGSRAPVWATETGRQVHDEPGRDDAARYLVRQATLLRSAGVQRMYWYLLRDYASFKGMGLLRDPDSPLGRYAPTPAYVAYANLIAMLDGARFVAREETDPRTRIYRFERDGQEIRVAWSDDPVRVTARAASALTQTDLMGGTARIEPGAVTLRIDENPRYFTGPLGGLAEPRTDRVIADSEADFALEQGQRGWHYGVLEAGGTFTPLTVRGDAWDYHWGDARKRALKVGRTLLHPARAKGKAIVAARRWESAHDGPVRLTGAFHHRRGGDGVRACVLRDGARLWCEDLPGERTADARFDLDTTVAADTRLDFVVDPGPAGNIDADATALRVRILAPR